MEAEGWFDEEYGTEGEAFDPNWLWTEEEDEVEGEQEE